MVDGKVVKEFHVPKFPNSLIYGTFRKSKARRSYEYALELGDMTPKPIEYFEERKHGLLGKSYYVSEKSALPLTLREGLRVMDKGAKKTMLQTLGWFTAELHKRGFYPLDFTAGNLLVSADGKQMQIVDLNRMSRCKHIRSEQVRKQFAKLPLDANDMNIVKNAYENIH